MVRCCQSFSNISDLSMSRFSVELKTERKKERKRIREGANGIFALVEWCLFVRRSRWVEGGFRKMEGETNSNFTLPVRHLLFYLHLGPIQLRDLVCHSDS